MRIRRELLIFLLFGFAIHGANRSVSTDTVVDLARTVTLTSTSYRYSYTTSTSTSYSSTTLTTDTFVQTFGLGPHVIVLGQWEIFHGYPSRSLIKISLRIHNQLTIPIVGWLTFSLFYEGISGSYPIQPIAGIISGDATITRFGVVSPGKSYNVSKEFEVSGNVYKVAVFAVEKVSIEAFTAALRIVETVPVKTYTSTKTHTETFVKTYVSELSEQSEIQPNGTYLSQLTMLIVLIATSGIVLVAIRFMKSKRAPRPRVPDTKATKYCINCGTSLSADAKLCSKCGATQE